MSAEAWRPDAIARVTHQWRRRTGGYAAHAAVNREAAARLHARLELLAIDPGRVLDLGSRDGHGLLQLAARYPDAAVMGVDPVPHGRVRRSRRWLWPRGLPIEVIAADPHRLPLADACVDLVVSNLLLPFCHSPAVVFAEVLRVLAPGGAFLFSSAGPDTLKEYQAVWSLIDGWPHVFGLLDIHDLGDAMLASGFDAPVLDRENLRVEYPTIDALQCELRALGAGNLARGRRHGLMSPEVRISLRTHAGTRSVRESPTPEAAAHFAVTVELLQGHAWKRVREPQRHVVSEQTVPLDALRRSLRQ